MQNEPHQMTRTERRVRRNYELLLEAFRHQIVEVGVESTSVASVAERADMALGSFYNHFDSRRAALDELIVIELIEPLTTLMANTSDEQPHHRLEFVGTMLAERFADDTRRRLWSRLLAQDTPAREDVRLALAGLFTRSRYQHHLASCALGMIEASVSGPSPALIDLLPTSLASLAHLQESLIEC